MEDKMDFIRRMHNNLLAKIALDKGKKAVKKSTKKEFTSYEELWEDED